MTLIEDRLLEIEAQMKLFKEIEDNRTIEKAAKIELIRNDIIQIFKIRNADIAEMNTVLDIIKHEVMDAFIKSRMILHQKKENVNSENPTDIK